MSDLNYDLHCRHLSDNATCACGFETEDASHYLLSCPLFQQARMQSIALLPPDVKSDTTALLFGRVGKTNSENKEILQKVGDYIHLTNRFLNN